MFKKIISFALFGILIFSHIKLLASNNIYWYMGGRPIKGQICHASIFSEKNMMITISDCEDYKIRIFDLKKLNLINIIPIDSNEETIASPDGNYLFNTDNTTHINIFNFESGELLYSIDTANIGNRCTYEFSQNCKYFIKKIDSNLLIYSLQNGALFKKISFGINIGEIIDTNANISYVDILGKLIKFNVVTGQRLMDTIIYPEIIYDPPNEDSAAFYGYCKLSKSENLLLIINMLTHNLKVYDFNKKNIISDFNYNDSIITFFYFSADESSLMYCSTDNSPVIIRNLLSGDTVKIIDDISYMFFPSNSFNEIYKSTLDGRYLNISYWNDEIYDFYDIQEREQHPIICNMGEILKTAFSKDNKFLYTYEKNEKYLRIQAYDIAKKKRVWVTDKIINDYYSFDLYPYALSSTGKFIAVTYTSSRSIMFPIVVYSLFDSTSGRYKYKFYGHREPITSISFSDDEKLIASADSKGTVNIWDFEKDSLIKEISTSEEEIFSIKFINNDEIQFTCKSGNQSWSIAESKRIDKFAVPIDFNLSKDDWTYYPNFPVVYSNDGTYCAYAWQKNGVNVYNTKTNDTIGRFDTGEVLALAFSDDNKYLVTSYKNVNYIKIWDFLNKKELARYDYNPFLKVWHHLEQDSMWAPLEALSFSHDGKYITGGNYDGSVIIWENTLTGVKDVPNTNNNFEIYPNPANNTFRLKYNSDVETQVQLSIYDYLGNEVLSLSEPCVAGANEKTVDCSRLATGYYLVKVRCGASVQTQSLVILK